MTIPEQIEASKALPLEEQIDLYNACTVALQNMLGWNHPALSPQLIPIDSVVANDYNPNKVAPPEMGLLKTSIFKDGLTMPVVVCDSEGESVTVVDGFHRRSVCANVKSIRESLRGYLIVTKLNKPLDERISSTVRHNMARGSHQTELSSKLIHTLKDHNWSDTRIAKELGMQPDEVLRLKQVTGLAELFKDKEFSKAWEATQI